MRSPFLVSAALLGVLTGCGSPAATQDPRSVLRSDVNALTAAAQRGSLPAASAAAVALRQDVTALRATGSLSPERAQTITDQIARVLADLTPKPTTRPSPSPAAAVIPKGHGKGKDGGNGKDNKDNKDNKGD
jgi:hypothetical protein